MRRTGIRTDAYFGMENAEEGFRKMQAHGYSCADYQNFLDMETKVYALRDSDFEKRLLAEKKAADQAGITIYQTHAPFGFPPIGEAGAGMAEQIEVMKKLIWGTALLGGTCLVVHPVLVAGTDAGSERVWETNLEFYNRLIPAAKETGVFVCTENLPIEGFVLSRAKQTLQLVQELNSDCVKICLDTGHCSFFGESPADALRLLKRQVKALHVHDNDGRDDWHWIPFHGKIDWLDFKEALSEIEPGVPVSLETNVNPKMPAEIKEYFELGLSKIAQFLAE